MQLVDRYFSNKQTEIFCLHLFLLTVIPRVDRHGNVGLVGKFEFLLVAHVVKGLVFLDARFRCIRTLGFDHFGTDFGAQIRKIGKQLVTVNFAHKDHWDVWIFMFESAMNKHTAVYLPASMTETLDWLELIPFRRLGVIDLHRNIFANLIRAASDHHHKRAQE